MAEPRGRAISGSSAINLGMEIHRARRMSTRGRSWETRDGTGLTSQLSTQVRDVYTPEPDDLRRACLDLVQRRPLFRIQREKKKRVSAMPKSPTTTKKLQVPTCVSSLMPRSRVLLKKEADGWVVATGVQ
ncbi:hypothetical protein BDW75DRAFT_224085 [Aspergillus navahoensis]